MQVDEAIKVIRRELGLMHGALTLAQAHLNNGSYSAAEDEINTALESYREAIKTMNGEA